MSRDIDALVAKHVMGLEVQQDDIGICVTLEGLTFDIDHYSTDIAAAWEVVEKEPMMMIGHSLRGFFCNVYDIDREHIEHSDTAPMAICLAALKAKGVDVPNHSSASSQE